MRTLTARLTTILLLALPLAGCINYHDSNDHGGEQARNGADDDSVSTGGEHGTDTHSINGSIYVPAGQPTGDASTVNGSVRIADHAQIEGGHSVNGGISLGNDATAGSLTTVNGGIVVGDGAQVHDAVSTVNGSLSLHPGSAVGGRLSNVNGTIIVAAASVGGGISTVNGNIDIGANARIKGGITVHQPTTGFLNWWGGDKPRVVVGPGATVEGDLRFEREVRLFVSDTATVGPITGATAVKFSGDRPPG